MMDYLIPLSLVCVLAFPAALSARYGFLTIPWIEIVFIWDREKYRNEVRRLCFSLVYWIGFSLFVAVVVVYASSILTDLILLLLTKLTSESTLTKFPRLVTVSLLSALIYIWAVRRARIKIRIKRSKMPTKFLEVDSKELNTIKEKIRSRKSNESLATGLKNQYTNWTGILAGPYEFFYTEIDHFVALSSTHLLEIYGYSTVMAFFEAEIGASVESEFAEISQRFGDSGLHTKEMCFALTFWKIKAIGYYDLVSQIDMAIAKQP